MTILALVATLVGLRRRTSDELPAVPRSLVWSVGIGVVLWIPPLLDQLTNEPGNLRELADHFGSPPEAAIGLGDGLRIMARHLDAATAWGPGDRPERFIDSASEWRGRVTFIIWVAAAIVALRRLARCEPCTS